MPADPPATRGGSAPPPSAAARLRLACALSAWLGEPGRCGWCNGPLMPPRRTAWCSERCRRAFARNHTWTLARAAARRRAGYSCSRPGCDGGRRELEVNHIDPRNGAGYGDSCAHHADNLEALCHPHHVEITNVQRLQRTGGVDPR